MMTAIWIALLIAVTIVIVWSEQLIYLALNKRLLRRGDDEPARRRDR